MYLEAYSYLEDAGAVTSPDQVPLQSGHEVCTPITRKPERRSPSNSQPSSRAPPSPSPRRKSCGPTGTSTPARLLRAIICRRRALSIGRRLLVRNADPVHTAFASPGQRKRLISSRRGSANRFCPARMRGRNRFAVQNSVRGRRKLGRRRSTRAW